MIAFTWLPDEHVLLQMARIKRMTEKAGEDHCSMGGLA
jgi:hypothetical protein